VWVGAFASNIGTWMETVGLGIFVERTTGQAAWVGLVAAAGFVPSAVVGPFGGALADRLPRKALLVGSNTVAAALAIVLTITIATDVATAPLVAAIALVNGCIGAVGFPAFMAILPELVPEDELAGALALSSAQYNLGRIIGPVLAGLVIGFGGYEWAFALNAASFVAPVLAILPLTIPTPVANRDTSMLRSIREGLSFVRHEPGIRSVIGYFALNSFLAAPFIALIPSFATLLTDREDLGTSVLVTGQGVGAVLMALSLNALMRKLGARDLYRAVVLALPLALIAYAGSPNLVFGAITIIAVGAVYLGGLSTFNTITQLRTPAALRGRVLSTNMIILGSLYPLGSVVQGWVGDQVGLRATTMGAAALLFVVSVLTGAASRRFGAPLVSTSITGSTLDAAAPPPGAMPSGAD